jgi:hypothetical protein
VTTTSNATLVLSRGELYFSRFIDDTFVGEGELYLGNTPGFSLSRTVETVERMHSLKGQLVPGESIVTREVHTADITTDNINPENIALWFGSDVDRSGQAPEGMVSESITAKRGRYYQLGLSKNPIGVRYVEPSIKFWIGGTEIPVAGNLLLDRIEGRFFVLEDAENVTDGTALTVTFEWRRSFSIQVAPEPKQIRGSLRFVPKNAFGPGSLLYFPYVTITAKGEIDFKASEWMEFDFAVEIKKVSPSTPYFYALQTAPAEYTADELSIIEIGKISLYDFPYYENLFDTIINTSIPDADYGQVITFT